jgi:hypothetical protein
MGTIGGKEEEGREQREALSRGRFGRCNRDRNPLVAFPDGAETFLGGLAQSSSKRMEPLPAPGAPGEDSWWRSAVRDCGPHVRTTYRMLSV